MRLAGSSPLHEPSVSDPVTGARAAPHYEGEFAMAMAMAKAMEPVATLKTEFLDGTGVFMQIQQGQLDMAGTSQLNAQGRMPYLPGSTLTHMHVHAYLIPGSPISGEPLWFTIDGRFLACNDVLRIN